MPIGLLQMLSAGVMASLLMGPAAWLARADLQTVTVIVERADGTYQPDLTRDDIAVVVEGQPRPVESVTPVEAPLTLLVILDVTMSVHPLEALGSPSYSPREFARRVHDTVAAALRPGDRVRLGSLGSTFAPSARFTSDSRELGRMVDAAVHRDVTERLGPSPIWDAIHEALALLADEPGHRAIILFSDGMATSNRRSVAEVAQQAADMGVPVHVISLAWDVMVRYSGQASGILQQPSRGLHHLADATGGVFLPMAYGRAYPDLDAPLSPRETLPSSVINRVDRTNQMNPWPQDRPEQAFRRALAALRASHTVSFRYQAVRAGRHALSLDATRTGLVVRAPRSFLFQP